MPRPRVFATNDIPTSFGSPELSTALPRIGLGGAIRDSSEGLAQFAETARRATNTIIQKETADAEAEANVVFFDQATKFEDGLPQIQQGADHTNYRQRVRQSLDTLKNEGLQRLKNPLAQRDFLQRFGTFDLNRFSESIKVENNLFTRFHEAEVLTGINKASTLASRASSSDEAFNVVGQEVLLLERAKSRTPFLAERLEKLREQFIKRTVGNLAQAEMQADPAAFLQDGFKKYQDATFTFRDDLGVSRSVDLSADPAFLNKLLEQAPKLQEHNVNTAFTKKRRAEEEQKRLLTEDAEVGANQLLENFTKPEALPSVEEVNQFAARSATVLPVEFLNKLREMARTTQSEGVQIPGVLDRVKLEILQGHRNQYDAVTAPGLTTKERVEAFQFARTSEEAGNISRHPTFHEMETQIITFVAKADPRAVSLFRMGINTTGLVKQEDAEKASLARLRFYNAAQGKRPEELQALAEQVIQEFVPGFSFSGATKALKEKDERRRADEAALPTVPPPPTPAPPSSFLQRLIRRPAAAPIPPQNPNVPPFLNR